MDDDSFERRGETRIVVSGERALRVSQVIDVQLLDISPGGVSFRSLQTFKKGVRINIGSDLLSFGATVLAIHKMADDPQYDSSGDPWAAYPYRIRCRYASEEDREDIDLLMALVMEEEEETGLIV